MEKLSFSEGIKLASSRLLQFDGRSRRSEFWWWYLALCIPSWIGNLIGGVVGMVISLAVTVCLIPAGARRLHDTGRSGWLQLLILTIIGIIPLIIWWAQDSDTSENKYGPSPKYPNTSDAGGSDTATQAEPEKKDDMF